jgi:hypothetical protein
MSACLASMSSNPRTTKNYTNPFCLDVSRTCEYDDITPVVAKLQARKDSSGVIKVPNQFILSSLKW